METICKRSLKAVQDCALLPLLPLQHLRTSRFRLALSCPSPPSQPVERTLRETEQSRCHIQTGCIQCSPSWASSRSQFLYPGILKVRQVVVLIIVHHIDVCQAWNTGTCLYMIWTGIACFIQFINSIVWNGNAYNPAPVWCDISE